MKENDTFELSQPIEATVIGEQRAVVLSAGTLVTVVSVFGDPDDPVAYEIEAFLPKEDAYALATIEARGVA